MIKLDIWGTCFSRELFNHSSSFEVNTYLMQQTIYGLDKQPVNLTEEQITTEDGYKFKERMLYYELNKLAIKTLQSKHSDIILIDLFDQIRSYLNIQRPTTSRIISTSDMKSLMDRLKIEYTEHNPIDLKQEYTIRYLKQYIDILLSLYKEENIILNIGQIPREYYIDGKKESFHNNWIIERELLLKVLEQYFLELLPNCKTLRTKYTPIVDINHYLGGPHPLHFESIYYEYRAKVLEAILTGKDILPIEEEYLRTYNNRKEEIKHKKLILKN